MAKMAVFGCLEKYLFTLFCFEIRKAQKSHCESVPLHLVAVKAAFFPYLPGFIVPKEVVKVCGELIKSFGSKEQFSIISCLRRQCFQIIRQLNVLFFQGRAIRWHVLAVRKPIWKHLISISNDLRKHCYNYCHLKSDSRSWKSKDCAVSGLLRSYREPQRRCLFTVTRPGV